MKAGAKGYLLKDSLRSDIVDAIRAVSQGRSFLTRKISRIMQEDYVRQMERRGVEDSYDLLTDREREILQLVAEGKANKEVAGLLNISLTTVETHRTHILQKLGPAQRSGADPLRRAEEHHLVSGCRWLSSHTSASTR